MTVALAVLLIAAVVPLRAIFIGTDWVRPVVGGVLLSVGIGWGARRLGAGPITHLVMTLVSLAVFITIAFLPSTALWGLLPTPDTLPALRDLFLHGLELVEIRPSPTFPEAGLLLLAVGGSWLVAYLADGMLFVLASPVKAVTGAVVLWAVPLAIAPQGSSIALPAATLLAAAALVLLLGTARATARFGVAVRPSGRTGGGRGLPLSGVVLTASAIVLGLALASVLPGFRAEPLYTARGGSGTTITTNPIVDIRQRLVASDTGPVLQVTSERPVYLRTTALDAYDEDEQWTAGTISGQRVSGIVDSPPPVPTERVDVGITIDADIESGAVLAPAPFQPVEVSGPKAAVLRYDRTSSTLTVPGDAPLVDGDAYAVAAAIPQPSPDALRAQPTPPAGSAYTQLPSNVPDEVVALARQIVNAAGATTMFDAALAIQDELRTWSYSTQPDPGLGATAMLRFIDAREGYCEQFAGTMAVMLRTLGIPSRLAVGYTPGTQQPDGSWEVTNANSHAWVEVHFGDLGWIPFEPTPRTDGNVLVTSTSAVVPAQTAAQQAGEVPASGVDAVGPGELSDLMDQGRPDFEGQETAGGDADDVRAGAGGTAARVWPWAVAMLAALGVAGLVVGRRAGRVDLGAPPAERIATARRRVEVAGAAVGRGRHPAETDVEYLSRIAGGDRAGMALARPATRAVYAPAVAVEEAVEAESAARALTTRLVDAQPAWRRAYARLRLAIGR